VFKQKHSQLDPPPSIEDDRINPTIKIYDENSFVLRHIGPNFSREGPY
jgi:hypothetical protein